MQGEGDFEGAVCRCFQPVYKGPERTTAVLEHSFLCLSGLERTAPPEQQSRPV